MSAGLYDISGFSTVMEKLAGKLVERDHEVTIGALFFRSFPLKGGYEVVTIPVGNILKLRRFLGDFDVVHNHHPITNYLALVSRNPFAYHYHGAPNFGKGSVLRYNMLLSIKLTSHLYDAVIAVSKTAASELRRYFNFNNLNVISNGVDIDRFKIGLEEKYRKGTPQLLFVGNLYKHKMVKELIFAMKELVKSFSKAYLQIVGEGEMFNELKGLIVRHKLDDHIGLVGRVDDCDLPFYYASCDVYVTASRWELFGLPLLEAMACGKPVIASAIPAHMELLDESQAGLIYAEGDIGNLNSKIVECFEKAERFKKNAIRFANKHDWSQVADKLIRLYDRIISNGTG